jgi:hypothetical protein
VSRTRRSTPSSPRITFNYRRDSVAGADRRPRARGCRGRLDIPPVDAVRHQGSGVVLTGMNRRSSFRRASDELTSVPSFAALRGAWRCLLGVPPGGSALRAGAAATAVAGVGTKRAPASRRDRGRSRRPRPRRRVRCFRVAPIAERVGRARRRGRGDRHRRRDARRRRTVRGHGGPPQRRAHEGRPLREQAGIVVVRPDPR